MRQSAFGESETRKEPHDESAGKLGVERDLEMLILVILPETAHIFSKTYSMAERINLHE
jgi:hypothetical protein